ncbi:MAG: hypothetical protein K5945_03810 [Bacteroidaceae bacterium]|nr:hypothetical protein [Bacteroidaceae bacterium]
MMYKYLLIIVLILTGVGVLGAVILGKLPESAMIINPYYQPVIYFCAYSFAALCMGGLFCIFIKSIRTPLIVLACILLMFFFIFACWNNMLEKISYKVAKRSEPVECPFVIEDKDYSANSLYIRFLDEEGTVPAEVPFPVLSRLNQGDTCVAVVWKGLIGINFISKIKNVRRSEK